MKVIGITKGKNDDKKNSQKQGNEFEEAFCEFIGRFLKECFQLKSFVDDPIRQNAGSQYGRDITARWKSNDETDFRWWFECKSHISGSKRRKEIHQREIADKIIELLIHDNKPSCFCIVSPHIELNTWLKEKIGSLNKKIEGMPEIIWWTPKTLWSIKKAIALYPDIWKKIYGEDDNSDFSIKPEERDNYLKEVRDEFINRNKKGTINIEVKISNKPNKDSYGENVRKQEVLNEELVKDMISTKRQVEFLNQKKYE